MSYDFINFLSPMDGGGYPRSVTWMRSLGETLANTIHEKRAVKPPTVNSLAVLFRNVLFLFIVLFYGFRRLAPPYK